MHMDNAMRTDRVREPYFVRDTYIIARRTMRYNRGFLYLQESIDRAIIEAQVGQKVAEPAVQMQPFPYPCFQRDEWVPLKHRCTAEYAYTDRVWVRCPHWNVSLKGCAGTDV